MPAPLFLGRRQNLAPLDPCFDCRSKCYDLAVSCKVDTSCQECFRTDDEEACAACSQNCLECKETGEQEACRKCSIDPGMYCQYDQIACLLGNCFDDNGPCSRESNPRPSQRKQSPKYFSWKARQAPMNISRQAQCFNDHQNSRDLGTCLRPTPTSRPWSDVPYTCGRNRSREEACSAVCQGLEGPRRDACYMQCRDCYTNYWF